MQLVPSGPGYPTEPNLRMVLSLIQNATERVSITSPYFVPDEALLAAMTTAAYRGIKLWFLQNAEGVPLGRRQIGRASYRERV